MKWLKKALKLSNPVGQAMQAYEQITGKEGASVKVNGSKASLDGNVSDIQSVGNAFEAGRETIKEAKDLSKDLKSDKLELDLFKSQDLLNTDASLYEPMFKRDSKFKKEQEGMLSLFNARKDDILSRRRTPGISQTRF